MALADRYVRLTGDAALASCPDCDAPLRPRLGTDVQAVEPVLESLRGPLRQAYLARVFTAGEISDSGMGSGAGLDTVAESLAARFAAKEAVVKVLRPGPSAGRPNVPRPPWTDIEICREPDGSTRLDLHGAAARQARTAGLTGWTCSLAHDGGMAVATVAALASAHVRVIETAAPPRSSVPGKVVP